jgi:RHS repeat-associated protein
VLIPALALATILLSIRPLHARQVIDPRSGRLFLATTDLSLQAGAVQLELLRVLETRQRDRGLLGTRWRLNWEVQLIRAGSLVLLGEATGTTTFAQDRAKPEVFTDLRGGRIIFRKDGRAIRTNPEGTLETFDAEGRLVERDYRNGNTVVLRYDPQGRLSRIEGPKGIVLQLVADAEGRLVRIKGSTGATARYTYEKDHLTGVQVNGGPTIRYAYGDRGLLTKISDPRTGVIEFAYDAKGRVASRRWADGSQERYEYSDAANRVRRIDASGGVTTTQWSADGRRVEVTDPLGQKSIQEYDAAGRVIRVTTPAGQTRFSYDAQGRITVVENAAGQKTRTEYRGDTVLMRAVTLPDGTRQVFEHDNQLNLTAITIGNQTISTLTYYPDGLVKSAKGPGTQERTFTYHRDGRVATVTDSLGHIARFEYDRRGNVARQVNPLGGVTVRTYDDQNRLVSETDPTGGVTRYEYDEAGRRTRVIDPLGGQTTFTYDARGRQVAITDPGGRVTRYDSSMVAKELAIQRPGGLSERSHYDPRGQRVEETDVLGRTVRYGYDAQGRLTFQRLPTGQEVRYRYDTLGQVVAVEDSVLGTFTYQRDAAGRVVKSVSPDGSVLRYRYDPLGRLVEHTDQRGKTARYRYGPSNELTQVQTAGNEITRYEYDKEGRLTTIVHPGSGVTRFAYDAMGNLVSTTDALGNRVRHVYDQAGRRTRTIDALGHATTFGVDAKGQLVQKRLASGSQVTYEYGPIGELLKADDGTFPVAFRYDRIRRLKAIVYPKIKSAIRYEYNRFGLPTKLIAAAGQQIGYQYDTLNRLESIRIPDGGLLTFAYDGAGRLGGLRYPNGVTGRWEYDRAGRVKAITYRGTSGQVLAGWTYRYDPAGNPIEISRSHAPAQRYGYDANGRLIEEVTGERAVRYRYLPGGNRARRENGGESIVYKYDTAGRVVEAGAESFSYDAAGQIVQRSTPTGNTSYEYDQEGRLARAVTPDGAETAFGYTQTGERVWRRSGEKLTYFLTDGLNLVQELDESGKPLAFYVHGPGIDWPLVMVRDKQTYFYHADARGNIGMMTNSQGKVAATYETDAFGNVETSTDEIPNPFIFSGRAYEPTLGLYYFRARYYDPTLGRFLTPDPARGVASDPATLNRYVYARNAPTRYRDPFGLYYEIDYGYFERRGISPQQVDELVLQERNRLWTRFRSSYEANPQRALYEARRAVEGELWFAEMGADQSPRGRLNMARRRLLDRGQTGPPKKPVLGRTMHTEKFDDPGRTRLARTRQGRPVSPEPPPGLTPRQRIGIGVGGSLITVAVATSYIGCVQEGHGHLYCAAELGAGVLVGGVFVAAATTAVVLAGAAAVAVGAGAAAVAAGGAMAAAAPVVAVVVVVGGAVAGIERMANAPETAAVQQQRAQQQQNLGENMERVAAAVNSIGGKLAALEALRGQIINLASFDTNLVIRLQRIPPFVSALMGKLRPPEAKLLAAAQVCDQATPIKEKMKGQAQVTENAKGKVVAALAQAVVLANKCPAVKDPGNITRLYEQAGRLAAEIGAEVVRLKADLSTVKTKIAQSKTLHNEGLREAEAIVPQITEYNSIGQGLFEKFLEESGNALRQFQVKTQEFNDKKNQLQVQINRTRYAFPSEIPAVRDAFHKIGEYEGQLWKLTIPEYSHVQNERESFIGVAREALTEIKSAKTKADAKLAELKGKPLCDEKGAIGKEAEQAFARADDAYTDALLHLRGRDKLPQLASTCLDKPKPEEPRVAEGGPGEEGEQPSLPEGWTPGADPGMGGGTPDIEGAEKESQKVIARIPQVGGRQGAADEGLGGAVGPQDPSYTTPSQQPGGSSSPETTTVVPEGGTGQADLGDDTDRPTDWTAMVPQVGPRSPESPRGPPGQPMGPKPGGGSVTPPPSPQPGVGGSSGGGGAQQTAVCSRYAQQLRPVGSTQQQLGRQMTSKAQELGRVPRGARYDGLRRRLNNQLTGLKNKFFNNTDRIYNILRAAKNAGCPVGDAFARAEAEWNRIRRGQTGTSASTGRGGSTGVRPQQGVNCGRTVSCRCAGGGIGHISCDDFPKCHCGAN